MHRNFAMDFRKKVYERFITSINYNKLMTMQTSRKISGQTMAEGFIQNFVETLFTENSELLNEKFMELPAKDMFNVLGKLLPYVASKQGVKKDVMKEEIVADMKTEETTQDADEQNEEALCQGIQDVSNDDDSNLSTDTMCEMIVEQNEVADTPPHPVKIIKKPKLQSNHHVPFYVGAFAKHRRRKY